MAIVYLHIGTAKTGTTALQRFFEKNKQVLEKHNIFYPDLGIYYQNVEKNRNAHFLVGERFDESWNHITEQENQEFEEGMDSLKKLAETYSRILLSDESLWWNGGTYPGLWEKLKKSFDQRGLEVKIIVYFRRQDSFAQSHWAQTVRGGATHSFEEYIHSDFLNDYPIDYYKYLSEIARQFGKENIIVRSFEKRRYRGEEQTIYSDFLDIFGVKLSDGFVVERSYQNMKLKGHYLEILRMLNNFQGISNNKIITTVLKDVQSKKIYDADFKETTYFPSVEAQESFLEQFATGNERIAREYQKRNDGRLFYPHIKNTEQFKAQDNILLYDTILVYGKCLDRTHRVYEKQIEQLTQEVAVLKKQVDDLKKENKKQKVSIGHRIKRKIKGLSQT